MTYTYNRKGITRKVLSEIVRGLGAKDRARIWYDTRYAQDGRQRRYGVSQS